MVQGGTLYSEIWEVKLPLAYEVPALLALVSGGNILVHHLLNVMVTMIAGVASGLLVALLVHDLTADRGAALVAGVSVLLLPGFFYLPAFGFKAKFFVTFTSLSSIHFARTDRSTLSGASAAACVGFYHAAAIIPILAVGLSYQYNQLRGAARAVAGGGLLTAVMVAPVVFAGDTDAMIAEAILIPLIVDSGSVNPIIALLRGGIHFGIAIPAVLLGVAGILSSVIDYDWRETWWIVAAAGWSGFIVFFIDYDNYPDLIPGLVIVAIGVGVVYDKFDQKRRRSLAGGLVSACIVLNLMLVVSVGGVAGSYTIEGAQPLSELEESTHQTSIDDGTIYKVERPDVRYLYWNQIESDTCHIRLSGTELRWLQMTNKPLIDRNCGDLSMIIEVVSKG